MCATRLFRISAANIGPNRLHQNRTVSWLMSIPRSAKRSSTLRSDSGYFTYISTARLIFDSRKTQVFDLESESALRRCRGTTLRNFGC